MVSNTVIKGEGLKSQFYLVSILMFLFIGISINGQGVLLRGEKWKKFNVQENKVDFYVAQNGNDSWSGTLESPNSNKNDGPFKTMQRAQKAVRELKNRVYKPEEIPIDRRYVGSPHELGEGKDILVLVREGYYYLTETLEFKPEDGGERVETNLPSGAFEYHKLKDYFVTYAAYPGEKPVISGGKEISNWKKEGEFWKAKISTKKVNNLIIDGVEQTLARTPNEGYFTVPNASKSKSSFSFNSGEILNWDNMESNRIRMYLRWHYGNNNITKVDETKNIAYLKDPQDGLLVISPRYYIENVKALLDVPGEWFYDVDSKEVFICPPKNISNPNSARIVTPVLNTVINISGTRNKPLRNLRFYGISFESTEDDSSVINIRYANKCEIVDSRIEGAACIGIKIGLGSYQTKILDSKFIKTGISAIRVEGNPYPESWADIVRETLISNNYFERCGSATIAASNVLYTTISHNEISNNLGRTCIYVGGWANIEEAIDGGYIVEYNHIHNAQSTADDSGVITSGGYTYNSIIRKNLIHHVYKGEFNDNVAIWFDNMSYGWKAEDNIYYALEQGEMKLCAANLVDNIYGENYKIEIPKISPENIIVGNPDFTFSNLKINSIDDITKKEYKTGEYAKVNATIKNNGSSGVDRVSFTVNGKVIKSKKIPIIKNNEEQVYFDYLFSEPGEYRITIGSAKEKIINVSGKPLSFFYDSIKLSSSVLPEGNNLKVTAKVKSVNKNQKETEANLVLNNEIVETKTIIFKNSDIQNVEFNYIPQAGNYKVRVGNSNTSELEVYSYNKINIAKTEFSQYCAARAEPHEIKIDTKKNKYSLKVGGIDFYHGEDSYATAYVKDKIKGNFVATIKLTAFGDRTNEWFRAGLFARNDMDKSFGTGMGSKGSVLMFATPGRAGMNWDEHGDRCMHKANSENHPKRDIYPIWIKLERHGNSFSGYVSYDGENWVISRHTKDLPGVNESIHLGIAAGAPDQRVYSVDFSDFNLIVQED